MIGTTENGAMRKWERRDEGNERGFVRQWVEAMVECTIMRCVLDSHGAK